MNPLDDQVLPGALATNPKRELNGMFLPNPRPACLATAGGANVSLQSQVFMRDSDPSEGRPRLELELDGASMLPFHFLRTGDRLGRAVVKIQRSDGATGTGFLIAPDVVLTNHHVIPDAVIAASSLAMANYEVSPPSDPAGRPGVSLLDPVTMFVTNAELDFTFCGVRGLEYLGVIPLDRERMHVAVDEAVTIVQHPRGRPKEISLRDNRVVLADGVVVQYSCDTEPGSSGAPVFNNQWKPVAIHHASVLTDSPEGRRVAAESRSRYLNEGIRLSAIALWLETAEVNGTDRRHNIERLRALFGGLNQRAGFFGALGARTEGRSATETVADAYRDRRAVLDVGLWDTRALVGPGGEFRDVIGLVGQAVAEMGLDVWCFSHADPGGLGALCDHLWAAHGMTYQPISISAPAGSGSTSGILVRPSKTLAAARAESPPHVRLRTKTRRGRDVEFHVVVVPTDADPATLADLDAAITPKWIAPDEGWILLGDALSTRIAGRSEFFEAGERMVLAAANPHDGAVAVLLAAETAVARVFVSPNLTPLQDPAARLVVTQDRELPASVKAFSCPRPIAARISLEGPTAWIAEAVPAPPAPARAGPADTGALDLVVEQKLRAILAPFIAKMVAELTREGSP